MPKLVYDVVFNFSDTKVETVGDRLAKNIRNATKETQDFNKELLRSGEISEKTSNDLSEFASSADSAYELAGDAARNFNDTQKRVNTQVKNTGNQFASANQLVFSFSDGIQDAAQFSQGFGTGMRAIGNNISFTAELLGVTARKAKVAGVSMRTALASAITPVTGAILALNIALTAGQFLFDRWGKEAKEQSKAVKKALSDVSESLFVISDINDLNSRDLLKSISNINTLATNYENYAETVKDPLIRQAFIDDANSLREQSSELSRRRAILIDTIKANTGLNESEIKNIQSNINLRNLKQEQLELDRERASIFFDRAVEEGSFTKQLESLKEQRRIQEGILNLKFRTIEQELELGTITNREANIRLSQIGNERLKMNLRYDNEIQRIEQIIQRLDALRDEGIPTVSLPDEEPEKFKFDFERVDTGAPVGSIAKLEAEKAKLMTKFNNASLDAEREVVAEKIRLKEKEIDAKKSLLKEEKEANEFNLQQIAQVSSQIIKGMFGDSKAAAIATAVIDSSVAFNKALASAPPPFNYGLAAGVAASAFKQIQNIRDTDIGNASATSGSASTGGQNPFIRREGEVEPPQFDPRQSRDSRDTTFVIEQRVKNKELAILVREGNNQIRTNQVSIN